MSSAELNRGLGRTLVCFLPLLCPPVHAADSGTPETAETAMKPILVEGSALEETLPAELSAYGAELEVIEREQLDETGLSDAAQALERLVPGLHISPKAGRGDYVNASLQGSRTEDILWLVDGVRINNRLFGGSTPLDSLTTHMIERIEVLKGGQGLFYGTQAVAGVVNIVLRDPEGKPGGEVRIGAGSLDDNRLSAHVQDRAGEGKWLLFADHDESGGYEPFRDEAYQANARTVERGFERNTIGAKLHLSPEQGQSLRLLMLRNEAKADYPRPYDNFKAFNDREEYIASAKWDHQLNERFGYFIKAYWHQWWTDYTRLGMDTAGNVSVINDRDQWGFEDYGLNLTGRYVAEDGSELLGGIDYQRYWGEDFVLRIDGKREAVTAGFLQYRPVLPFSPETGLALGARYNDASAGGDKNIWNISLEQPLPKDLRLKASVGTAFRLPSAFELFVIDPAFPAGNEDLDPEESLSANVALQGRFGRGVGWRVGGFYREIDDLIQVENGTFVNSDARVEVSGAELGLSFGGNSGWQLDLDATYSDATPDGSDEQIDEIPKWFAHAALVWDAVGGDRGWRLAARHTGDTYSTLSDSGRQAYGDYTVLDASAYTRFGAGERQRLTLRLENITDEEYATRVSQGEQPNGDPYRYDTLGVPFNVQVEYSRRF